MYKLLILTLLFPFFAFSVVSLDAICSAGDQEQREISNAVVNDYCEKNEIPIYSTLCKNAVHASYDELIDKGWTRKELNFLAYHTTFSSNIFNRHFKDLIAKIVSSSIKKPTNRSEFLELINEHDRSNGFGSPTLTRLEQPITSGCESLFPPTDSAQTEESTTEAGESIVQTEESTTEAGTECLECQIDQLNSEIDQLGEQIASLQSRLEQIKPEEITCTHDKDGSSFNVRVGSSFDCPQVDPYNCQGCQLSYFGNTHDIMVITYACSDGPNPSAHRNLIFSEPTAGAGFTAPMFEPPSKLGITCKKAETTSTQNQNSGNSPSNR